MSETIRLKMLDKDVAFKLSDNQITESSIKHAFLLPPDAIVKLSYQENGQQIDCRMNETGTTFLLPDGWSSMQFHVESDQAPSRPSTPADQVKNNAPVYVPIDTGDLILQLEKYFFYEEIGDNKACFTVLSSHYAISFNHGPHQTWRSSPDEKQTSVTICNQEGQKFETKVVECDAEIDFIVVHSDVPLVSKPPIIEFPKKLERYILLGYPESDSNYQALEGIFSTIDRDKNGRMRGSSGSTRGYSGGPVFNYKGELLGINVANESAPKFMGLNGNSTVNEIFNEMSHSFPFLSVIVPAAFILFKYNDN